MRLNIGRCNNNLVKMVTLEEEKVRRTVIQFCVQTGVPVYLAPWAACPPGVKLSLGSLPPPPRGWIPWGILPSTLGSLPPGVKLPLGSLPPGGEDTLAWAACPPPQENLTALNAERFYFFKIKILVIETWEN